MADNNQIQSRNGRQGTNVLTYPEVVTHLAKFANKNELKNLRQMSQMYYGSMKQVFLEKLDKPAFSWTWARPASWSISPAITNENAYIFRELILDILYINEPFVPIMDSLRIVAPYIKSLVIKHRGKVWDQDLATFLVMFREFSGLLSNVACVKFSLDYFGLECIPIIREICDLFPTTVKITVANTFDAHQITIGMLLNPGRINDYMQKCSELSALPVTISSNLQIHNQSELNRISQQLTTNAQFYRSINNFHFSSIYIPYPLTVQNEPIFSENSFAMLMSTFNNGGMELETTGNFNWLIRNPNLLDWKIKITKLNMWNYTLSLAFLRDFENLTDIDLRDCHWNACLFPDRKLSDDGNLKQIFNGLWNITVRFIGIRRDYELARIYPGNPLALILIQLVHEVNFESTYWEQFKQDQTTGAQEIGKIGIEQGNQDG